MEEKIIVVGSGNAGMSAAIAALEKGASVLVLEKADEALSGGNTKYTAGAMRFCFDGIESISRLLRNPDDERLMRTDLGSYSENKFAKDLENFNKNSIDEFLKNTEKKLQESNLTDKERYILSYKKSCLKEIN